MTVDYGTITDDPLFVMPCACGATVCRGEVTGRDWQRPDLQKRYAGHWVPALQWRISSEHSSNARTLRT